MTYHAKIIAGGKIVIPADFRRAMELKDGDSLLVERDGQTITLKSRAQVLREVQESVRKNLKRPVSVDDLIAMRRAEAASE